MIVNGIALLNKAPNASSNRALLQLKRLFNAKKAGHTGSLDPLAQGILPICFGEATKFSQYLLDADKQYTVVARLGFTTVTGDAEGELIPVLNAPIITKEHLEAILPSFLGPQQQIPPMYSALKQQGVRLYELARQGKEVIRPARNITISKVECLNFLEDTFTLLVQCSKGTYIRTLCEDIARALGSGAYVLKLQRDITGPYSLKDALSLEEWSALDEKARAQKLYSPESAVAHYPEYVLSDDEVLKIRQGKVLEVDSRLRGNDAEKIFRLHAPCGEFIGLGEQFHHELRAKRLLQHSTDSSECNALKT